MVSQIYGKFEKCIKFMMTIREVLVEIELTHHILGEIYSFQENIIKFD